MSKKKINGATDIIKALNVTVAVIKLLHLKHLLFYSTWFSVYLFQEYKRETHDVKKERERYIQWVVLIHYVL